MVMKMNKEKFIKTLATTLNIEEEKCLIINDILENNFFISSKNQDKIIDELIKKLNITPEEAENIYDTAITIIKNEVKNKLKHPFGSQN